MEAIEHYFKLTSLPFVNFSPYTNFLLLATDAPRQVPPPITAANIIDWRDNEEDPTFFEVWCNKINRLSSQRIRSSAEFDCWKIRGEQHFRFTFRFDGGLVEITSIGPELPVPITRDTFVQFLNGNGRWLVDPSARAHPAFRPALAELEGKVQKVARALIADPGRPHGNVNVRHPAPWDEDVEDGEIMPD